MAQATMLCLPPIFETIAFVLAPLRTKTSQCLVNFSQCHCAIEGSRFNGKQRENRMCEGKKR